MDALRSADTIAARLRVRVRGHVQGVGFRPFVATLARRHDLSGWVAGDGADVVIEVEGAAAGLFTDELRRFAPPLARVDAVDTETLARRFDDGFRIVPAADDASRVRARPDSAPCEPCLAALFDPASPHWRDPFVACRRCGPHDSLAAQGAGDVSDAPTSAAASHAPQLTGDLDATVAELRTGGIVAVEGAGGIALLCDARDAHAVARLRRRTGREAEPFAVMVANLATARRLAHVDDDAAELLSGPARPIVTLARRDDADLAAELAPGHATLGVMLPPSPLHYLLFHDAAGRPEGTAWLEAPQRAVWAMAEATAAGRPRRVDDDATERDLAAVADLVVGDASARVAAAPHSVVQPDRRGTVVVRRGRGLVPETLRLPRAVPAVIALGDGPAASLCVTRGDAASLSPPLGDPGDAETRRRLVERAGAEPVAVAHDLRPHGPATRAARALDLPTFAVQHHHAHLAAVAAEHGHTGPLLGLALDGGGFGPDGTVWGGELMEIDGPAYRRLTRLTPLPQPGGDRAAREPWRMAAAALHALERGDEIARRFKGQPRAASLDAVMTRRIHTPDTSSLARMVDAAAGLLGVATHNRYDGEAARRLEALVRRPVDTRACTITPRGELDLRPLFARLLEVEDAREGAELFHGTVAAALARWLGQRAEGAGRRVVALGGGCLLNRVLRHGVIGGLEARGFTVLTPRAVPPGDGGLALGQAWVAALRVEEG